jgi:diguanylate cyclase
VEHTDHARAVADSTWESLRANQILPTPRNFEVWFSYCSDDKPRLRQRIERYIKAAKPLTPGVLDDLYREFFAAPVDLDLIKENSQELRQIATRLTDQVIADCGTIDDCATALGGLGPVLDTAPTIVEMRLAVQTLRTTTAEVGDRMRALEKLFTASITRIGELNEKLARSEKEATCDGLTGLANRRLFDTALVRATAEASGDGSDVALLMLDIDHFKKFNDAHGHPMGDNVLRLVAQILTNHIKGRDLAARYGGEEFAVILLGAGLVPAMTVGEQIRSLLDKRSLVNRTTGQNLGAVTCSIGVAVHRKGEVAGKLLDRADQALYKAKRAGRNRVVAEMPAEA